jgi:hypothetical protein
MNQDREELRQRLQDLQAVTRRLDKMLANGRRLPALDLARCAVAIDQAATKLERHADNLSPAGD